MKKIVVLASLLCFSIVSYSQSPIGKNGKQFNAGLGLTGSGVPVYIGLDFGVHPDITLGVEMSYKSYNDDYSYWDGHNNVHASAHHNIIGLSGNMNYHFNTILEIPRNWDLYAGLNVGYWVWTSPNNYSGSGNSGLGLGLQIGGRYYFNNKIGINLEIGGPMSGAGGKIGVSIKI